METYHQMKVNWKILRSFKSDDQHVDFPSAVDHFGNDPASDFCFGRLSHPKTWCDRESWEEIAFQEKGTKEGEALHALRGCMGKFAMSLLWMSMKIPAFPVRPRSRRSNNVLPQRLGGTPRPSVRRFSSSWSSWQIPHPEEHYQIASIHLIRVLIKNWKHSGKTSPKRTRKLAVFLFFGGRIGNCIWQEWRLFLNLWMKWEESDEVSRFMSWISSCWNIILQHRFDLMQARSHSLLPLEPGTRATFPRRWSWGKTMIDRQERAAIVECDQKKMKVLTWSGALCPWKRMGSMKTNMLDVRM